MPFGKYEGRYLIDLPEYYVVWYHNKGFPKGQLGDQLRLVYELKLNGLENLVRTIQKTIPQTIIYTIITQYFSTTIIYIGNCCINSLLH